MPKKLKGRKETSEGFPSFSKLPVELKNLVVVEAVGIVHELAQEEVHGGTFMDILQYEHKKLLKLGLVCSAFWDWIEPLVYDRVALTTAQKVNKFAAALEQNTSLKSLVHGVHFHITTSLSHTAAQKRASNAIPRILAACCPETLTVDMEWGAGVVGLSQDIHDSVQSFYGNSGIFLRKPEEYFPNLQKLQLDFTIEDWSTRVRNLSLGSLVHLTHLWLIFHPRVGHPQLLDPFLVNKFQPPPKLRVLILQSLATHTLPVSLEVIQNVVWETAVAIISDLPGPEFLHYKFQVSGIEDPEEVWRRAEVLITQREA
ncbi:hypothetical protein GG344DRAFT_66795 [Lentinula edodes]|nr:hypothetical protein GG344DRAFT_66795 [Lentinula edodes]